MNALNIFYTILTLIPIGMLIHSIIKNKKITKQSKRKNKDAFYINNGLMCFLVVFIVFYTLIMVLCWSNYFVMFWIVFMLNSIFETPNKISVYEDGIYFNNLFNYSILFVPYEKVDSWHFNKYEKRKLLIETKEKSVFYKLQEFKIKEEEVDVVTELLLNYCGEKKDR